MGLRRVRGVRSTLPTNTIIGRRSGGKGAAEMLDLADVARDLQTYGAGASGGTVGLPTGGLAGQVLAIVAGAAAWSYTTAITAVGIITSGQWRGTKVDLPYGGTNANLTGTGPGFLKQATLGANVSVATIVNADLPTSGVAAGSYTITSLTVNAQGIITAASSGSATSALTSWKIAVAVATNAALPTCTYANGAAGVGATLTATANGAISIDGVSPFAGQGVLVKNQANTAHNGIYAITQTGSAGTPFILTRRTDYDGHDAASTPEFADCVTIGVGTVNASTIWSVQLTDPVSFGTTTFTWVRVGSSNFVTLTEVTAAITPYPGDWDDPFTGAWGSGGWGTGAWGGLYYGVIPPSTAGQLWMSRGDAMTPEWSKLGDDGSRLTYNGSRYASVYAAPAGSYTTTSLTELMVGYGITITPGTSGDVVIIAMGRYQNQTAGDQFSINLRYGTGAAPAANAAVTGTIVGTGVGQNFPIVMGVGWSIIGEITGLTLGTTYWIDLSSFVGTGGTGLIISTSIFAKEQV